MGATAHEVDALHYPESDEMGEHELQRFIVELLRPLLERWLREQGRTAHAGADQFFYWKPGDFGKRRAPDVYVIEGLAQDLPEVGSWKHWEGHRPDFALEVCGDDWQKDYDLAPADYAKLGTRELLIFDAGATERSARRVRWQVLRAGAKGRLARVYAGDDDRVYSEQLRCWIVATQERGHTRLRLATGERGEALVPTDAERERAARDAHERERAAHAGERAEKEVALARVAELERRLAELERKPRAGR